MPDGLGGRETTSEDHHEISSIRTTGLSRGRRNGPRALYQELMEGWNKGDGEAFAAPFAEDGDLIRFDGTRFNGRREIAQSHQPLFETHLKGTRLGGQIAGIRFLNPDIALMHEVGGTIMRGKSLPLPEPDSIQTLVATKCGSEWCLAAFQNTRIRPIGRNVGGTLVWIVTDWLWSLFRPMK